MIAVGIVTADEAVEVTEASPKIGAEEAMVDAGKKQDGVGMVKRPLCNISVWSLVRVKVDMADCHDLRAGSKRSPVCLSIVGDNSIKSHVPPTEPTWKVLRTSNFGVCHCSKTLNSSDMPMNRAVVSLKRLGGWEVTVCSSEARKCAVVVAHGFFIRQAVREQVEEEIDVVDNMQDFL
jgi:hypothetical protein